MYCRSSRFIRSFEVTFLRIKFTWNRKKPVRTRPRIKQRAISEASQNRSYIRYYITIPTELSIVSPDELLNVVYNSPLDITIEPNVKKAT